MDIQVTKQLLDKLQSAQDELSKLLSEERVLTLDGHQDGISVNTGKGSRTISVTYMDRSYSQRVIHGREMILLGIKKVYRAAIEDQKAKVHAIQLQIQEETRK